ncbi:MAG: hypothetical protein OXG78_02740 [Chloroflexi bacterium]|nr:hypothetical protein [Chloroflexota bacterium]
MSVAIISSLYRCEEHLPAFAAAVFGFARRVSEVGISVHYLPIVNDATRGEVEQIDRLAREINANYFGRMTPRYVPRETLYASWNRAIDSTQARFFAPWNADDIRSADAFIEGFQALQAGAELVDFDFTRAMLHRRLGVLKRERRTNVPCLYDPARFTGRNGLGPFFMASRALVGRAGRFDEHFRVAGDMEWASRVHSSARFQPGRLNGGEFTIHGGNLSNTGGEIEEIEVDIIFMRRRDWKQLRPANPRALREAWENWGNPGGIALRADVADFLWGPDAERRWRRYRRERRQSPSLRRLRLALASRGWIYSEEWAMAQRGRDLT